MKWTEPGRPGFHRHRWEINRAFWNLNLMTRRCTVCGKYETKEAS